MPLTVTTNQLDIENEKIVQLVAYQKMLHRFMQNIYPIAEKPYQTTVKYAAQHIIETINHFRFNATQQNEEYFILSFFTDVRTPLDPIQKPHVILQHILISLDAGNETLFRHELSDEINQGFVQFHRTIVADSFEKNDESYPSFQLSQIESVTKVMDYVNSSKTTQLELLTGICTPDRPLLNKLFASDSDDSEQLNKQLEAIQELFI